MSAFEDAVATALHSIPIMQSIVKEECWTGFTIVRTGDGSYRVYKDSAWDVPSERPLLPWSPPSGKHVAHVSVSGHLAMLI